MRTNALKAGARKARLRLRRRAPHNATSDTAVAIQIEENGAETPEHELDLDPSSGVVGDRQTTAEGEDLPPFDPPDTDDVLGLNVEFEDEFLDDDAPFDAPDELEESVGVISLACARTLPLVDIVEPEGSAPRAINPTLKPSSARTEAPGAAPSVPPITVQAHWDRAESGEMFATFAADKRMARAEINLSRGGMDGAIASLQAGAQPDLVVVDTDLSDSEILNGADQVLRLLRTDAKLIVIGAINDIRVMRILHSRGASYIMAPVSANDLTEAVCAAFSQTDRSRVIAVMGARGGIGASCIAQNLAWCVAEKLNATTTLIDLDVGFGAAAVRFEIEPRGYVTDLMDADVDDDVMERVLTRAHERLLIAPAPAAPDLGLALTPSAVETMITRVRRTSTFVVLDLPHAWAAWVKQTLIQADEIVIVAGADLASLRNADNVLKLLRDTRVGRSAPKLVLSMTGIPKRPEIAAKEFAETVGVEPVASFAFDPELYGAAEERILCEIAPKAKQAMAIESLAVALTGCAPSMGKPKAKANTQAAVAAKAEERKDLLLDTKASTPSARGAKIVVDEDGLSDAERAYVEKIRRKAIAALEAKRRAKQRPSRLMARVLGIAAATYALGLATLWTSRERSHDAAAAEPASSVALVTAPTDPFAAMRADYQLALTRLDQGDTSGVTLLRRSAEAGFPLAQHRLAKLYENGEGVDADPILARHWTERAAAGGNVRAMHDLGYYFARGDAATVDEATAFRWFRQAAEFGFADSQYNLGVLYQQGRGVSADMGEALFWFTLAADNGDEAAQERIAQLGAELSAFHLEQARARAAGFTPRAPDAIANEERS